MHWIITINEDLLLKIEKILSSLFLFFFFRYQSNEFSVYHDETWEVTVSHNIVKTLVSHLFNKTLIRRLTIRSRRYFIYERNLMKRCKLVDDFHVSCRMKCHVIDSPKSNEAIYLLTLGIFEHLKICINRVIASCENKRYAMGYW